MNIQSQRMPTRSFAFAGILCATALLGARASVNGVTAAPDGSVLYVNDWNDGTLRIVPLAKGVVPATIKLGSFHPDNVHSIEEGKLLIAGQFGKARDIMACAKEARCSVGSMIVVVESWWAT